MGRRVVAIELGKDERNTLEMWLRAGKTERRLVQRADVILLSSEGVPVREISLRIGLSMQSCSKWRNRFRRFGLNGLKDEARKGRSQVYTAAERLKVISLACTTPADGNNQWSIRKLAEATGMGSTTVHTILQEGATKPHNEDRAKPFAWTYPANHW